MTDHNDSDPQERMQWYAFDGGVMLDCSGSSRLWKVVHSHFTFCVLHHGGAQWTYRQRSFSVAPESVYVCEPGEVHTTTSVRCPGDFSVFFLDPEAIGNLSQELGAAGDPHFRAEGLQRQDLWRAFTQARALMAQQDGEGFQQRLSQLLSTVITSTEQRARHSDVPLDKLVEARALLEQQFRADPTNVVRLQPIARQLGVAYHSLVHSFSKRFRLAPYQYVSALRAQYALKLLRQGPTQTCASLTALAHQSGYSDNAHLTRSFRQHWGQTPSVLAHQLRPAWLRRRPTRGAIIAH